jgi:hypothetical protein
MVEEEPEYGDAQLMTWNPHVGRSPTSWDDYARREREREKVKGGGPYRAICDFLTDSGLLHDRVRLDQSFPMGLCSTSGDQNSLRYDLGPHHCDCHVSTQ